MTDNKLQVEVVTPEESILADEATEVVLPGEFGALGILPGHVPLVTALQVGSMQVRKNGLTKRLFIDGGFAEISDDHISVLAERCEKAEDIDVDEAKQRLTETTEALDEVLDERKQSEPEASKQDVTEAKKAVQRAKARVKTVGGSVSDTR